MKRIIGTSAAPGIVYGKVFYVFDFQADVSKSLSVCPEKELLKFQEAVEKTKTQLTELYDTTRATVGEQEAEIFDIHLMMLTEDDYQDSITDMISNSCYTAAYAVEQTKLTFMEMFESMSDQYMKERSVDIKDISERLIRNLLDKPEEHCFEHPSIIAARDLTPSQTVTFNRELILGFILSEGSTNSHTAILARTMGIPAMVACGEEINKSIDGESLLLNSSEAVAVINPDPKTIAEGEEKISRHQKMKLELKEYIGRSDETKDGKKIKLYANICSPKDIEGVLANDAAGIGLFRSEFLFVGADSMPTEQEQFDAYKKVAVEMGGKPVIIRTIDVGADKSVSYFEIPKEENPALGLRAIRICLKRPEIFKVQLRAILRASAYGNIKIMFPMIASEWEIKRATEILSEVKEELKNEGVAFDNDVQVGIMIETPAAVMISDILAQKVDFFSLGTNDLTQYTLAIDRQNELLEPFYNAHHPALLRMIKQVIDNAHKNNIWAGICGELAADKSITKELLKMGVDELSVNSGSILAIRKIIRETDLNLSV